MRYILRILNLVRLYVHVVAQTTRQYNSAQHDDGPLVRGQISKSSWGTMIFYQEGPLGSAGGTCPSYILEIWPRTMQGCIVVLDLSADMSTNRSSTTMHPWFGAKSRECSWGTYLRYCPRVPPGRIS